MTNGEIYVFWLVFCVYLLNRYTSFTCIQYYLMHLLALSSYIWFRISNVCIDSNFIAVHTPDTRSPSNDVRTSAIRWEAQRDRRRFRCDLTWSCSERLMSKPTVRCECGGPPEGSLKTALRQPLTDSRNSFQRICMFSIKHCHVYDMYGQWHVAFFLASGVH